MTKTFDAVDMQHAGGAAVQSQLQGLSPAEVLAYWARADDELEQLQGSLSREQQRQLREERAEWDARAENQ